jgi:hypothetical protein
MSRANGRSGLAALPLVRCAIYTRKSTEEGLEQDFNTLDAQRESAEAFVRSQAAGHPRRECRSIHHRAWLRVDHSGGTSRGD